MDSKHRLTVLVSQTCGATSLNTGQLELMLHRNLENDDGRGLGEGNHDTTVATHRMRLLLNHDADTLQ